MESNPAREGGVLFWPASQPGQPGSAGPRRTTGIIGEAARAVRTAEIANRETPGEEANMIISMKRHSSKQEVEAVCERIREFGYKIHTIEIGRAACRERV